MSHPCQDVIVGSSINMVGRVGKSSIITVGIKLVKCRSWTYKFFQCYGGLTRNVTNVYNFSLLWWVNTRCYRKFYFGCILVSFDFHNFGWMMHYNCVPHAIGSNLPFFCKKTRLKLFHEFIVDNHPILREEILRKISR